MGPGKNVLLTGNTGYIGTVMTRLLNGRSYDVTGLDCGYFGDNCLFPVPRECLPYRQITKDIRNVAEEDLDGIDAVIHLAALSNDPLGELNPSMTEEINYVSTVKLAQLCRRKGIERFIFASSCSIYGISGSHLPIKEDGALNPITSYAKAKVKAEIALAGLAGKGFDPVFMRNATVYGVSPRLRLDLVVNNLLAWAYLTKEVAIMSDGKPWRPIIHIEDFCSAFIAALEAPSEKIHCEAFNVGIDSENYRVNEIAEEVRRAVPGSAVKILNKTGPDERSYKVDFSKIKNTLTGFKPKWSLKEGVAELLEAYKRYGLTTGDFNSAKYFRIRAIRSLMENGVVDNDLFINGGKR